MQYFLATYTLSDGAHEHSNHLVIRAESDADARRIANSQQHDADFPAGEELTYWDYGDGTTASCLDSVEPITTNEAKILHKLGVASLFNPSYGGES